MTQNAMSMYKGFREKNELLICMNTVTVRVSANVCVN